VLESLTFASSASAATTRVVREPIESESFPEQWEYETSTALFNAVCCSRRAGKSTGAVRRAARFLLRNPGQKAHYVSLIRRNAKKHFWWPFTRLLQQLGCAAETNETDMMCWLPNGSWVQALSCDDVGAVKSVQGDWSGLFLVDECHLPVNDVLTALIDVAATPMLTDRGGMLDLLGVVPEVEGTYYDKALDSAGWRQFRWTQFDHDYPQSREVKLARVVDACAKRGLDLEVIRTPDGRIDCGPATHPIVQRQYFGKRVRDPSTGAYEYSAGRNDYDLRPDPSHSGWLHALGLDLGFSDRDAIVVLAWRPDDRDRQLYEVFRWQMRHEDVDQLADVMRVVWRAFMPVAIVGDHGGHGAVKVLETIARRLSINLTAKPGDVMMSLGLVNDDLRTGRLLIAKDIRPGLDRVIAACGADAALAAYVAKGADCDLGGELLQVRKSVNPRTLQTEINKRGFHSDLSEALRYAHSAAFHFRAQPPAPPEQDLSREERFWRDRQQRADYDRDPYS